MIPNEKEKMCQNATTSILFGMAAMPFPCSDILLIQGNLPRIFPDVHFEVG